MESTSYNPGAAARSAKLTPARRAEIAKKAAMSRWSTLEVICGSPDKPLMIGTVAIECYVLNDGTRVITQASFLRALGRHPRPRRIESSSGLPPILQGKALAPFVSDRLMTKVKPIPFRTPNNARADGYEAELLPDVCDAFLAARRAGALPPNQQHIADQAEILVRGLARVGIIALVDEATGYQDMRERDALARILEAFVANEIQAYMQTFPPDYYKQLFRLRDLPYPAEGSARPQYFGHLTNDLVYKRLAPGVLAELKKVQRRDDDGRPKDKLFQRLTNNIGYPKLREHLGSVVTLMKISRNWEEFQLRVDQIHPRFGETGALPFDLG